MTYHAAVLLALQFPLSVSLEKLANDNNFGAYLSFRSRAARKNWEDKRVRGLRWRVLGIYDDGTEPIYIYLSSGEITYLSEGKTKFLRLNRDVNFVLLDIDLNTYFRFELDRNAGLLLANALISALSSKKKINFPISVPEYGASVMISNIFKESDEFLTIFKDGVSENYPAYVKNLDSF